LSKQEEEGWLSPAERASVSATSLRHIFASSGYATGTIAVNVTWMKRGFSACQTHRSMYTSIFNHLTHKVMIRPASSQAQDRESSPIKDQRFTTVLRHQMK